MARESGKGGGVRSKGKGKRVRGGVTEVDYGAVEKLHELNAVQNVFVTLELNCRGARTNTHTRLTVTDTQTLTETPTK